MLRFPHQTAISTSIPRAIRHLSIGAILIISTFFAADFSHAVILLSTADPTVNTTPPTGALAGSGWQYEAFFGPFLATAIGPHHFLTAKHIGTPSNVFVLQGVSYTIVGSYDDPGSELRIFEVAETVPAYAPLYFKQDEQGRNVVLFGRGTQRGAPVYVGGSLRGWEWGAQDQVERWGENTITQANGYTLYATLDQNGGPNEAALSSGDSGGATFINDNGVWTLVGLNYSVDGPFETVSNGPTFDAVLFDARGLFDCIGRPISSSQPASTGFYAMRISDRLSWIYSVVFPGMPLPSSSPPPTPSPSPTPSPALATMLNPSVGSTLTSVTETFSWTAGSASAYQLEVGNSVGGSDIYSSGNLNVRSLTVNNIPTNGTTIYVRLFSLINSQWQSMDYAYQAYSYSPANVSKHHHHRRSKRH